MNKKFALSGALALLVASGSASALTLTQVIDQYGSFSLEDDNAETIVNRNGGTDDQLDVGDSLRGIISFPQIKGPGSAGTTFMLPAAGNSAVHAIFEIQVTNKVANATLGGFDYTFGANAGFGVEVGVAGAMVAIYESASFLDVKNCGGTLALCEAAAKAGTLRIALGLTGDVDEGWKSFGTPENTDLSGLDENSDVGSFNYNLGTLFSSVGTFATTKTAFAPASAGFGDGLVQWVGSGSVNGGADANPDGSINVGAYAPYTSSSDAQLGATLAAVPVPATIGLLGLGLLGLNRVTRRKRA